MGRRHMLGGGSAGKHRCLKERRLTRCPPAGTSGAARPPAPEQASPCTACKSCTSAAAGRAGARQQVGLISVGAMAQQPLPLPTAGKHVPPLACRHVAECSPHHLFAHRAVAGIQLGAAARDAAAACAGRPMPLAWRRVAAQGAAAAGTPASAAAGLRMLVAAAGGGGGCGGGRRSTARN